VVTAHGHGWLDEIHGYYCLFFHTGLLSQSFQSVELLINLFLHGLHQRMSGEPCIVHTDQVGKLGTECLCACRFRAVACGSSSQAGATRESQCQLNAAAREYVTRDAGYRNERSHIGKHVISLYEAKKLIRALRESEKHARDPENTSVSRKMHPWVGKAA